MGRFVSTDLAWREGMPTWKPLSELPEFVPPSAPPALQVGATPAITPAPMPAGRTEPLAIWSLVLSLLGLFCCGFASGIPGIVCGHLALSKFQREPNLQGKGLATAGLVIGYVGIACWLIYIVFFGGLSMLKGISHSMSR